MVSMTHSQWSPHLQLLQSHSKCFHHFTWFYCNVVEEPAFDKDFAGSSFFFLFSFFLGGGGMGVEVVAGDCWWLMYGLK